MAVRGGETGRENRRIVDLKMNDCGFVADRSLCNNPTQQFYREKGMGKILFLYYRNPDLKIINLQQLKATSREYTEHN